jgi:hypothetical protein
LLLGAHLSVLAWALVLSACGGQESSVPGLDSNVVAQLALVEGRYQWNAELGRYVFSAKDRLEEVTGSQDAEAALRSLVSCLDDSSSTRSTLDGDPVAMGVLCYEALSQLVYYEPMSPDGDIAEQWPGHLTPMATRDEMRAAREAWEAVVTSGEYIFL